MPGTVTLGPGLANLGTEIVGGLPEGVSQDTGKLSPEYALAAWWKQQMPHLTDQQAYAWAQHTLQTARAPDKSNTYDRDHEHQANLLRVLGVHLAGQNPNAYAPPTIGNSGPTALPFGPQPDRNAPAPINVPMEYAPGAFNPAKYATSLGPKGR